MSFRVIRADYQCMVDIMVLLKLLDKTVDEYRHKESLIVEIPFKEYLNFVTYTLGQKKFMFTDSAVLKSYTTSYHSSNDQQAYQQLYKNYILDVMSAAAKELYLAVERNKTATQIRYCAVHSPEIVTMSEVLEGYDANTYRAFYQRLELLGYRIPRGAMTEGNAFVAKFIDQSVKAVLQPNRKEFIVVGA